jgi:SAM-dependent methyltransferase
MDVEQKVAQHYSHGSLEQAILNALKASGKDVEKLAPSDLSGADEFHLGWRAATVEFAKDLGLAAETRVLDIGSGIGGPARYFAETFRARVTGVDLTPEFVQVADALTRRCGLSDLVDFKQASGTALPFESESFDVATLIHVGMNVADKAALFAETRRVLKPGGRFGIYDIMLNDESALPYPMPWAATEETSFVEPIGTYRDLLASAGFRIDRERDRSELALKLGREMRENAERYGAPPLGPHLLMGAATKERLGNVTGSLARGSIAPVEIIASAI